MSSKHSPTQHSDDPKKTLCGVQTVCQTHTHIRTPSMAHESRSSLTSTEKPSIPPQASMLMRGTRVCTSTDCRTDPLYHLQSAPARTQRTLPPHITAANLYQTELELLTPLPENRGRSFPRRSFPRQFFPARSFLR